MIIDRKKVNFGIRTLLEKGSEWRRWYLHIHTLETALNDQFGNWEEYLGAIGVQTNVRALGVTDYLSITNYSKLQQFKAEGRIPEIDLLIPNILATGLPT